jgi:hypothetical protein
MMRSKSMRIAARRNGTLDRRGNRRLALSH